MLRTTIGLGVAFLVIALIAGLFGFIGVGSVAWEGAKIFFFIFLVLAVLAFFWRVLLQERECLTGKSLSSEASAGDPTDREEGMGMVGNQDILTVIG